jgi:hypothetical protein
VLQHSSGDVVVDSGKQEQAPAGHRHAHTLG